MERRADVAIAAAYEKPNFGTALQAFALQYALDELGVSSEILRIGGGLRREISRKRRKFYLRHLLDFELYRNKAGLAGSIVRRRLDGARGEEYAARRAQFSRFLEANLRFSPEFESLEALTEGCRRYRVALVGSDQTWLPVNVYGGFYALDFVPEGVRRASYAASFGVSELWRSDGAVYRNFLRRMDAISVRERSGRAMVRALSGRDAELVCDPTLLLTERQWREAICPEAIDAPERYILCYFLGRSAEARAFARRLRAEARLPIVLLFCPDEPAAADMELADCAPEGVGPAEFLTLLAGAEFVCTDSFHASALSLLFHRTLFAFHRHREGDRYSTNARLDSLLVEMGCPERLLLRQPEATGGELLRMDFARIDARMEALRQSSKQFLRRELAR